MKKGRYTGLEPLALALIFTPEPVTTVAGFALLGYSACLSSRKQAHRPRLRSPFEGFYSYSIKMMNKSTISYQIFTTRPGQLPFSKMPMPAQYQKA
ncbi:MAG: hypothetical protein P8105_10780 [Dehalococcoidia bacterium]